MSVPIVRSSVFLLLLVALTGCASATSSRAHQPVAVDPASLGSFDCVDRGDIATPPPHEVLNLGSIRDGKKTVTRPPQKPLITIPVCSGGKVPVSRTPARPNVAKGNPLIRPIDRPVEEFFTNPNIGGVIRENLFPVQKVYYIPPGADDNPHKVPPDPPGCNGTSSFGSCYYYGPASFSRTADGGGMTMRVESPAFSGGGHTLDEIAVQGGPGNGHIVELGWNLSTSQYPDADPHLFVFHWINWGPTCYDTCGWHQYSSTYFPAMNLRALAGRDVYIGYVFFSGNWWAWFDNQWLGYFSGSEWGGAYVNSSFIQWFGEVSTSNGIPPNVQMGDGRFPTDPLAARNATLCDVDRPAWVCWYRDMQSLGPNYPPYYDIRRTGFGETRYGGPGH